MKRFKKILLVHPCDPATLERAKSLARNNQATLTVIHVERELTRTRLIISPDTPALKLQDLVVKEYQSQLKNFIAPVKKEGVRISSKVVVGTPFLEIVREVIVDKHDLVMMTAEGKGGLKQRLFGSTSLHLMRKCPCPVWVMKPTKRKKFLRIMAAVDPDPENEKRDSLNILILQLAASLAELNSAELHVTHAWSMCGENLMLGRVNFSEAEIRRFTRQEAVRRRTQLNALLEKQTDGSAIVHFVKGEADSVIPRIAKAEGIDLLVMGTICRVGIPGFFIGNTAEKILDDVDCSVLTVKPEGFQSPVKSV